jgi:hypothetical protein
LALAQKMLREDPTRGDLLAISDLRAVADLSAEEFNDALHRLRDDRRIDL